MANQKKPTSELSTLVGSILLGRYTIQERVAKGGMSLIYRGQDERLQRAICLKVFVGLAATQAHNKIAYEHFVQEAFALSQLRHPNSLRIYDFGYLEEAPYSPFYISEYMDGGTLRDLIQKNGPLLLNDALDILTPIGGALSEAHSRGIIHRDIKPSNILFGIAGNQKVPKLADFGVAKTSDQEDAPAIPNKAPNTNQLNNDRISFYSLSWSAPEQLYGKNVDPSADIFALGLLTVYMLTGKKVYPEKDAQQTIELRLIGQQYLDATINKLDLPEAVASTLLRACQVTPALRYQTVDEFLGELQKSTYFIEDSTTKVNFPRTPSSSNISSPLINAILDTAIKDVDPDATPPPALSATPTLKDFPRREIEQALSTASTSSEAKSKAPGIPDLVLTNLEDPEVLICGHRLQLYPFNVFYDVQWRDENSRTDICLRLTWLPSQSKKAHLHLKGLSCFVCSEGRPPTTALDIDDDKTIEIKNNKRQLLGKLRFNFGDLGADGRWHFHLGEVQFIVDEQTAVKAVLFELSPGEIYMLAFQPGEASKKG